MRSRGRAERLPLQRPLWGAVGVWGRSLHHDAGERSEHLIASGASFSVSDPEKTGMNTKRVFHRLGLVFYWCSYGVLGVPGAENGLKLLFSHNCLKLKVRNWARKVRNWARKVRNWARKVRNWAKTIKLSTAWEKSPLMNTNAFTIKGLF
jgi:hypothetical protein